MELAAIQVKRALAASILTIFAVLQLPAADSDAKSAKVATSEENAVKFHRDFTKTKLNKDGIPDGWTYRGKMGTPNVKYELVQDKTLNRQVLKITADKASGVIMIDASKVDLEHYPVMRWRWKADLLPDGADATVKAKDDQGIALYAGYGKVRQYSISYAWQTENEIKSTGHAVYNMLVNVDWITMRNKKGIKAGWFTEEVNLLQDIRKYFKKVPSEWAITISSNSQYTASKAEVYIDFIEFVPDFTPGNKQNIELKPTEKESKQ